MERGGFRSRGSEDCIGKRLRTEDFFGALSACREYLKDILCNDIRGVLNLVLKDTGCHKKKKTVWKMHWCCAEFF